MIVCVSVEGGRGYSRGRAVGGRREATMPYRTLSVYGAILIARAVRNECSHSRLSDQQQTAILPVKRQTEQTAAELMYRTVFGRFNWYTLCADRHMVST